METPDADLFNVAIIYIKPLEMTAITVMLDQRWPTCVPLARGDMNEYVLGRIGEHNVVIVGPPCGYQGTVATAQVASTIRLTFPQVSVGILAGIGGGIPHYPMHDVRLGDIVVGAPEKGPAVVPYDLGTRTEQGFEVTRVLPKPSGRLLQVVNKVRDKYLHIEEGEDDILTSHLARFERKPRLRKGYQRPDSKDRLFSAQYPHPHGSFCADHDATREISREPRTFDDIVIHYGTILSGNSVMKSAAERDILSNRHNEALCIEMEAAGLLDVFPCLVVRGICDHADSHKNSTWQGFAAAVAAAYVRELLLNMSRQAPLPGLKRTINHSDRGIRTPDGGNISHSNTRPSLGVSAEIFSPDTLDDCDLLMDENHSSITTPLPSHDAQDSSKPASLPFELSSMEEKEDEDEGQVKIENTKPQWDTPGWLDQVMRVKGYCPDMSLYKEACTYTLDNMMWRDEDIRFAILSLDIQYHSKPFVQGQTRTAYYARTAHSNDRFVIKSFKTGTAELASLDEHVEAQALCKLFALEFNALVDVEYSLDFATTAILEYSDPEDGSSKWFSLEPYIDGNYVKYNNNAIYVNEDLPADDPQNMAAQAFSHFTFERSRGRFLVNDIQGVGNLMTDPAIHAKDPDRFKMIEANLGESGFKFFMSAHRCNALCKKLGLRSRAHMLQEGETIKFRKHWPANHRTMFCSNKLCRRILRTDTALESDRFLGFNWCSTCWPQLILSITDVACTEPGEPHHMSKISWVFHESQGEGPPPRVL